MHLLLLYYLTIKLTYILNIMFNTSILHFSFFYNIKEGRNKIILNINII